jgi:hypothetical protein
VRVGAINSRNAATDSYQLRRPSVEPDGPAVIDDPITAIALARDWRREILRAWAGADRVRQHVVAGIGRILHTPDGAGYLAIHWVMNGIACSYRKARDTIVSIAGLPGLARVAADEVDEPFHRGARYVAGLVEYRDAAVALAADQGWSLPPRRSGAGAPVDLPRTDRGTVRCPFHDDETPSLWVRTLPSGLVVGRCFAECCRAYGPIADGRMWNLADGSETRTAGPRPSADTRSGPPAPGSVAEPPIGAPRTIQMRLVPAGCGRTWARFGAVAYDGTQEPSDRARRVQARRRSRARVAAEAGEHTYESIGLRSAGPGDWRWSERQQRWWPSRFSVLGPTERIVLDVDGMSGPVEGDAAQRALEVCSWWPDFPIRGLAGASVMATSHSGMQLHLWLADPMSPDEQAEFFADPGIRAALLETGELLIGAVGLGGHVDPSTLHPGGYCRSPGPRRTSRGPHAGELYDAHWLDVGRADGMAS